MNRDFQPCIRIVHSWCFSNDFGITSFRYISNLLWEKYLVLKDSEKIWKHWNRKKTFKKKVHQWAKKRLQFKKTYWICTIGAICSNIHITENFDVVPLPNFYPRQSFRQLNSTKINKIEAAYLNTINKLLQSYSFQKINIKMLR